MRSYPCSVCGTQVHASDLCHCDVCAGDRSTCLDCCPIWLAQQWEYLGRQRHGGDDRQAATAWDAQLAGWNADADAWDK